MYYWRWLKDDGVRGKVQIRQHTLLKIFTHLCHLLLFSPSHSSCPFRSNTDLFPCPVYGSLGIIPEIYICFGVFLLIWQVISVFQTVLSQKKSWLIKFLHSLIHTYFINLLNVSFCCCCSVTELCVTLCDPMDCSTPGFPVLHCLLELAQTHIHWVSDAIQPSHPLSHPSPPALNLSHYWGLFQWVGSSHQVAKELELELQHQFSQWIFRVDFL